MSTVYYEGLNKDFGLKLTTDDKKHLKIVGGYSGWNVEKIWIKYEYTLDLVKSGTSEPRFDLQR